MNELSQSDRDEVNRAFLEGGETADAAVAANAGVDPKQFFCQYWEEIKGVLEFLKSYLPTVAKFVVSALIKAGDILHGKVCPTS